MELYAITTLAKWEADHHTSSESQWVPLGAGEVLVKMTFRHHALARAWVSRTGAEPLAHPAMNQALSETQAAKLKSIGAVAGNTTIAVANLASTFNPLMGWDAI